MIIHKPDLTNAEQLATENPSTFDIPPLAIRLNLAADRFAKICVAKERFWVRIVTSSGSGRYTGRVANRLVGTEEHGLQLDDVVMFEAKNIYDVSD